jgi:hypothetical protein
VSAGALEAIDRVLNRGGEAHAVLRQIVEILCERGGCSYAAVAFVDGDAHLIGVEAGTRVDDVTSVPVRFAGEHVADLVVAPPGLDGAFLERTATVVSAHCRVRR